MSCVQQTTTRSGVEQANYGPADVQPLHHHFYGSLHSQQPVFLHIFNGLPSLVCLADERCLVQTSGRQSVYCKALCAIDLIVCHYFYSFKHMACIVQKVLQVNTCVFKHSYNYTSDHYSLDTGVRCSGGVKACCNTSSSTCTGIISMPPLMLSGMSA